MTLERKLTTTHLGDFDTIQSWIVDSELETHTGAEVGPAAERVATFCAAIKDIKSVAGVIIGFEKPLSRLELVILTTNAPKSIADLLPKSGGHASQEKQPSLTALQAELWAYPGLEIDSFPMDITFKGDLPDDLFLRAVTSEETSCLGTALAV